MRLLDKQTKAWLERMISATFGAEGFGDYVLIKAGDEKIKLTTGRTIEIASKMRGVQSIGIYVAKIRGEDVLLSIEGSQILCKEIKMNRIELTEEQAREWMSGAPIQINGDIKAKHVVASYKNICMGCGRVSRDGKIYPQIPKWRYIASE